MQKGKYHCLMFSLTHRYPNLIVSNFLEINLFDKTFKQHFEEVNKSLKNDVIIRNVTFLRMTEYFVAVLTRVLI